MAREDGVFVETYRTDFLARMSYVMPLVMDDAPIDLTVSAMDILMSLECTWYTGLATFAETMLTCIPAQRPEFIENEPLRWYILGTLRACQMIEGIVRQANICPPEEFFRNTFGTLPEVDDEEDLSAPSLILAINACRKDYAEHKAVVKRLERISRWLSIVHAIYSRASIIRLGPSINELVDLVVSLLDDQHVEYSDAEKKGKFGIFPSMANCYLTGCPRTTATIPTFGWNSIITQFSNLVLSFKLLSDMAENDFPPFNDIIETLWKMPFHPILSSSLFLSLNENPSLKIGPFHIEQAACVWLGLPKFTRINIVPIQRFMMDLLQISCQSECVSHSNMQKLIRSIHEHLGRMDIRKDLYVIDYLRWWKNVLGVRVILKGLKLSLYERYELSEAFWALYKVHEALDLGRKARLALFLAQSLVIDISTAFLYRDCRFKQRWAHLLPGAADIETFDQQVFLRDGTDNGRVEMNLTDEERSLSSALLTEEPDYELAIAYFKPCLSQKAPGAPLPLRLRQPL